MSSTPKGSPYAPGSELDPPEKQSPSIPANRQQVATKSPVNSTASADASNVAQSIVGKPIPPSIPKPAKWAGFIVFLSLSAMTAGAWYYHSLWLPHLSTWLTGKAEQTKRVIPPVPVTTAVAQKRDLKLYLNGLGTVTSLKTVTVRSRVEGEIINVEFNEGQMVHSGRLLAEIDTRPFVIQRDQAVGQLERDQAALDIAKLNLKRLKNLLPRGAVNQQQVDEQLALVKQAEGAVKSDRAMIETAELQLQYCRIAAPITGRIGLRLIDVGNIVRANDPTGLAVITQLEPIALIFTIPQDDIPRVQKRMRDGHELIVDAYDRDFKTLLASGRLSAIDNQVDSTTGTLKMKAEFEKNDNILFPNQFVNTRLLVDIKKDAIVIPSAAVQRGPSSIFVYLVKSDQTVEQRNITIGPTEGVETSIESGLSEGELVVTDGIDKLKPGAKIALLEKKTDEKKSVGPNLKDSKSDPKADSKSTTPAQTETLTDTSQPNPSSNSTVSKNATNPDANVNSSKAVESSGSDPSITVGPALTGPMASDLTSSKLSTPESKSAEALRSGASGSGSAPVVDQKPESATSSATAKESE